MIRQPLLLGISVLCFLIAGWFAFNRFSFLRHAERATGVVESVRASNSSCGSKRRRYSCTKFHATVGFHDLRGSRGELELSAGNSRGSNRPLSSASMRIGGSVGVVYNPKNLREAYEDTFFGVWGTPIIGYAFHLATLFGSMTESRRRHTVSV